MSEHPPPKSKHAVRLETNCNKIFLPRYPKGNDWYEWKVFKNLKNKYEDLFEEDDAGTNREADSGGIESKE